MKIIALKTISGTITKDKEYEALNYDGKKVKILDDDGYEFQLSEEWFDILEQEQEMSLIDELFEVFELLNADDETKDVITGIIYDIATEAYEAGKNNQKEYINQLFKADDK